MQLFFWRLKIKKIPEKYFADFENLLTDRISGSILNREKIKNINKNAAELIFKTAQMCDTAAQFCDAQFRQNSSREFGKSN